MCWTAPHAGLWKQEINDVHVLLHCPKTELVWDQAITLASEAAVAPPAEQRYLLGGMSMEGRVGHLLRCKVLVDMHTEAPLGGAATHALVGGLSFVDAQLKTDRVPIRAMAAEAAKCKRADARAKAKAAQQGGPSPQSQGVAGDGVTPLPPRAGEVRLGNVT